MLSTRDKTQIADLAGEVEEYITSSIDISALPYDYGQQLKQTLSYAKVGNRIEFHKLCVMAITLTIAEKIKNVISGTILPSMKIDRLASYGPDQSSSGLYTGYAGFNFSHDGSKRSCGINLRFANYTDKYNDIAVDHTDYIDNILTSLMNSITNCSFVIISVGTFNLDGTPKEIVQGCIDTLIQYF